MAATFFFRVNGGPSVAMADLELTSASLSRNSFADDVMTVSKSGVGPAYVDPPFRFMDQIQVIRSVDMTATTTSGSAVVGIPPGTLPLVQTSGLLSGVMLNTSAVSGSYQMAFFVSGFTDSSGNLSGTMKGNFTGISGAFTGVHLTYQPFSVTGNVVAGVLTSLTGSGSSGPGSSSFGAILTISLPAPINLEALRPGSGAWPAPFGSFAPISAILSGSISATLAAQTQGSYADSTYQVATTQSVTVGTSVTGAGIPASTTVLSLNAGASTVTLSHNATASGIADLVFSTQWFMGNAWEPSYDGSGGNVSVVQSIIGPWLGIRLQPYTQQWSYGATSRVLVGGVPVAGVYGYANSNVGSTTGLEAAKVLNYAQGLIGAPYVGFAFPGVSGGPYIKPEYYQDGFCGALVTSILRYHPSATSWFDYSTTPPTLHISSDDGLGLPMTQLQWTFPQLNNSGYSWRPRYGLQLNAVVINYEQTSNGAGSRISQDFYPLPLVGPLVLYASFVLDEDQTWGTDVLIPVGEAERVYSQSQALQYDGALPFVSEPPGGSAGFMGAVVGITGGDPIWESARSVIQGVSEDMQTGRCSVRVGSKTVLGPMSPESYMALMSSRRVPQGRPQGQSTIATIDLPKGGFTGPVTIPGVGTGNFSRGLFLGV